MFKNDQATYEMPWA